MKNVLKINEYPYDTWATLVDDYEVIESEHRRGSNFYTTAVITVTQKDLDEFADLKPYPELVGTWRTNVFIHDTEYGHESTDIDTLTRVEMREVEKTIKVKEWIEVE